MIDLGATKLIRNQIVRGIQYGEYPADDNRIANLAAQEYACRYGKSLTPPNVTKIVKDIVPEQKQDTIPWSKRIEREMNNLQQNSQAFQSAQESIKILNKTSNSYAFKGEN